MSSIDKITAVSNLPIVGGIIASIGAGLCCAGPFVLLLFGVSGSWIGNLTLLEPYRPIFILLALALFSFAGWQVYPLRCAHFRCLWKELHLHG